MKIRFAVLPMKAVLDGHLQDTKLRTLAILSAMTDEDGFCYASVRRIAELKGVSHTAIIKDIKDLEERGYIRREKRGRKQTQKIRIVFDFADDFVETPEVSTKRDVETPEVSTKRDVETPEVSTKRDVETPEVSTKREEIRVNQTPYHLINREREETKISEVIHAANREVNAIIHLEQKARSTWKYRELIPEPMLHLADTFVEVSGITPTKKDIHDWIATYSEWLDFGATKEDVAEAYERIRSKVAKGDFILVRPGGLSRVVNAVVCERKNRKHNNKNSLPQFIDGRLIEPSD